MKKHTLNPIYITLLLGAALFQTTNVAAHSIESASLGNAATAIDYYQVHCFDNEGSGPTGRIEVQVKNKSTTTPKLSVQVSFGNVVSNSTDVVNGDGIYSPIIAAKGTDGFYYITVDKTSAGISNYAMIYHCKTSDNQHAGTEIVQLSNQ